MSGGIIAGEECSEAFAAEISADCFTASQTFGFEAKTRAYTASMALHLNVHLGATFAMLFVNIQGHLLPDFVMIDPILRRRILKDESERADQFTGNVIFFGRCECRWPKPSISEPNQCDGMNSQFCDIDFVEQDSNSIVSLSLCHDTPPSTSVSAMMSSESRTAWRRVQCSRCRGLNRYRTPRLGS